MLPSVSILKVWTAPQPNQTWKGQRVLAVVNPDGTLPKAQEEVKSLRSVFSNVDGLVGDDAQETRVCALMAQAEVIHLATHGVTNPLRPRYSHLVLAKARPGQLDDGLLDAHEIARKLDARKAQLVVLSACETHIGPATRGDEVQSLSNAFLYAGARQVLASLWAVSDRSTQQLMAKFYSGLGKGLSPATAIQAAMKSEADRNRHPYHWAGFHLIGDH